MPITRRPVIGECRRPWDYLRVVSCTRTDEAFRNPAESGCPLVKA